MGATLASRFVIDLAVGERTDDETGLSAEGEEAGKEAGAGEEAGDAAGEDVGDEIWAEGSPAPAGKTDPNLTDLPGLTALDIIPGGVTYTDRPRLPVAPTSDTTTTTITPTTTTTTTPDPRPRPDDEEWTDSGL